MYRRGADFEREVVNYFRASGSEAVRVAGSRGPVDVIAFSPRLRRHVSIQCKVRREDSLYLRYEEVKELVRFSRAFRSVPMIAWKPAHRRIRLPKNTVLVLPDHLERTPSGNYKIGIDRALKKGMSLEDLVKKRRIL